MVQTNTFAERLDFIMREKNITRSALAKVAGVNKANITRYLKGNYVAKKEVVQRIATVLNVTEDWLLGYDAPMFADDPRVKLSEIKPLPEPEVTRDIDPIYDALNPAGQQALCAYGRFLGSQPEYRPKEAPKKPVVITRIIPLLGQSFAAGSPEAPGDLFMQDYSTTDPHAEFAIKVNGDSMEPYLPDGSIALGVKRAPIDGEVGAWWLDGGFLVKQVAQDNYGNTYLFSLNRDRSDADETIMHDSGRDLRCVGTILMDRRLPLP